MIADDHQIILDGLTSLFADEEGVEVVGVAENGVSLLEQVPTLQPDLILLDINMPEVNGVDAARVLKADFPHIKVVMLSMFGGSKYAKTLLELGVDGYLLKNTDRSELMSAIQKIMEGGQYYSNSVMMAVMESHRKPVSDEIGLDEVSAREKDVLRLLAQEFTTAEIAEKLFISTHTVESHRKNLLSKLGKKNTAGLVAWAVKMGLG